MPPFFFLNLHDNRLRKVKIDIKKNLLYLHQIILAKYNKVYNL